MTTLLKFKLSKASNVYVEFHTVTKIVFTEIRQSSFHLSIEVYPICFGVKQPVLFCDPIEQM